MKSVHLLILLLVSLVVPVLSLAQIDTAYLNQINKDLPHKFKEIRTGATIEAVRGQGVVHLYILIDDIEQYDKILIERSDELQTNYSQCKLLIVEPGKYPHNYVELTDKYPFSSKMSNLYRIKTITSDDIVRMYFPVPITFTASSK